MLLAVPRDFEIWKLARGSKISGAFKNLGNLLIARSDTVLAGPEIFRIFESFLFLAICVQIRIGDLKFLWNLLGWPFLITCGRIY